MVGISMRSHGPHGIPYLCQKHPVCIPQPVRGVVTRSDQTGAVIYYKDNCFVVISTTKMTVLYAQEDHFVSDGKQRKDEDEMVYMYWFNKALEPFEFNDRFRLNGRILATTPGSVLPWAVCFPYLRVFSGT